MGVDEIRPNYNGVCQIYKQNFQKNSLLNLFQSLSNNCLLPSRGYTPCELKQSLPLMTIEDSFCTQYIYLSNKI